MIPTAAAKKKWYLVTKKAMHLLYQLVCIQLYKRPETLTNQNWPQTTIKTPDMLS